MVQPTPVSALAFECRGLALRYRSETTTTIFEGLDLDVPQGQFLTILGGSGVGKSTLLRIMAGLVPPSDGDVRSHGSALKGAPPGVVMVFQDYSRSLLHWRTVLANAMLGIERNMPRKEAKTRAMEVLDLVGLSDSASLHPWQLSGGMQQRLQIARALAMRPTAILMDEPFGALDAMTKSALQDQVRRLQEQTGVTFLFVTHDVDEAIFLGDRCIVMAKRPAIIIDDVLVGLGNSRDQVATRSSERFLELRSRLLDGLQHGGKP